LYKIAINFNIVYEKLGCLLYEEQLFYHKIKSEDVAERLTHGEKCVLMLKKQSILAGVLGA